ncbi:MAG: hypothetical protein U1E28_22200 [Beijerinckiaceae bacterium]
MPKFLLAALAAFALLSPALAQTAGKPYPPVAASYDRAAEDDADLAQLMKILRNAAQAKDTTSFEATISPGFVALDCSASPLKPCGPGKARAVGGEATRKQKPFERMRLAFCCEGKPAPDMPDEAKNDTAFAILGATLGANSIGANPDAKGQVCAPALPAFDRARAAKAARAAGVEPENLRVAHADIQLYARPARGAAPSAKLAPGDLAPVVTDLTTDTPAGWTAIGLPDGSIGFTNALGLEELTPAAICFAREKGVWRIVSTIQRN